MNKDEAAEFLRVSVRTLQRYAKNGRVKVTYKHSKAGGTEAVFDEAGLKALKDELARGEVRAVIAQPQAESKSLTTTPRDMTQVVALVAAAIRENIQPAQQGDSLSDLSAKLTLTEKEAARLSGLPVAEIRRARKAGKLSSIKTGSGHRISQEVLRAYTKNRLKKG
jgi:excisionase family DNA binding protein